MSRRAFRARVAHDAIGAVVHPITAALLLFANSLHHDAAWGFLIVQEVIAGLAHIFYCIQHFLGDTDGARNLWKWAEYAASATAGTLAVLLAVGDVPDWWWIMLLCITCATQQAIGYLLETSSVGTLLNFGIAWLFQFSEFIIIAALPYGDSPTNEVWSLRTVYILAWSPFGILAGYDILTDLPTRTQPSHINWIEAMYACLSWVSKLSIVILSVSPTWGTASAVIFGGAVTVGATFKLSQG